MNKLYYDPKFAGSFAGIDKFRRNSLQTEKSVRNWLSSQNAYTMHKPIRKKFQRRQTFSKGIDDLWQADLCDVSSLSSSNDGYRWLLTVIDVFSKYAWAIPVKNKTGETITKAFASILGERRPNFLQTDKGTEFLNTTFQKLLTDNNIKFYTSENEDIKAAVVERFNRTLKMKMWRYFTFSKSNRYVDVLPDLLNSYNNTYHRTIKMAPTNVTADNQLTISQYVYKEKPILKWKFSVDDTVRISQGKHLFRKGYLHGWSDEIFTISKLIPSYPVTYEIKDYDGEPIKGRFYEQELQKVIKTDEVYDVEKIIKTKKVGGKVKYFVKWKGYPDKFNSWVDSLA